MMARKNIRSRTEVLDRKFNWTTICVNIIFTGLCEYQERSQMFRRIFGYLWWFLMFEMVRIVISARFQ